MTELRYASPQALRQAARDRLRVLSEQSGAALPDLQRQFAYDRLLARIFTDDPDRWVLKGAAAMLARLPAAARHSKDVDLYRTDGDLRDAEVALRRASAVDLNDHFRFELGPAQQLTQGARALRVPVVVYLGPTQFSRFHVDLVADLAMTADAEDVPPLIDIDLGLPQPRYRAYPVADHIADKVCAMLETHPRERGLPAASTRYRDLVDLATFARTSEIDGDALVRALRSESARRKLTLPSRLPDPSGPDWRSGYARAVRDAPAVPDRDLDTALRTVRSMLEPILGDGDVGRWDPNGLTWR